MDCLSGIFSSHSGYLSPSFKKTNLFDSPVLNRFNVKHFDSYCYRRIFLCTIGLHINSRSKICAWSSSYWQQVSMPAAPVTLCSIKSKRLDCCSTSFISTENPSWLAKGFFSRNSQKQTKSTDLTVFQLYTVEYYRTWRSTLNNSFEEGVPAAANWNRTKEEL